MELCNIQDLDSNKLQLDKLAEKIAELEEVVQASNERKELEEQVRTYLCSMNQSRD